MRPRDFRLKILSEMLCTWLDILKILQPSLPFENNSGFGETSNHNPDTELLKINFVFFSFLCMCKFQQKKKINKTGFDPIYARALRGSPDESPSVAKNNKSAKQMLTMLYYHNHAFS